MVTDFRHIVSIAIAGWLVSAVTLTANSAEPPNAAGLEFFEKQIRPLLSEHCYPCHGEKKQESGLALNRASSIRRGGDRGTAIVNGDPDASLLIQAVRYTDNDLKMPPRGKLKEEQISALTKWLRDGAPLPADEQLIVQTKGSNDQFILSERRAHWSYQTIRSPAVPDVTEPQRCQTSIDRFILAAQQTAGLALSPPAEKRALIRRLSFDLIGLPPTPAEVADFLSDQRPDAYDRLVDRLLASPRYGERWGRHWLDVVRFSETLGFEFDYDLHNAWRYRDYVVRAFNANLPYDQFIIEHLAGDLLSPPRWHALDQANESILATGFWWMVEGKQTPVDIRQDQIDRIDNQLDVLGKAFLGQTIACARCHDHKFDAISTRDYYALAGYLKSSRFQQAFIDPPELIQPHLEALTSRREAIKSEVAVPAAQIWRAQARQSRQYLLAVTELPPPEKTLEAEPRKQKGTRTEPEIPAVVEALAKGRGLAADRLSHWLKALTDESLSSPDHPLHIWHLIHGENRLSRESLDATLSKSHTASDERRDSAFTFADFRGGGYSNWFPSGVAFGDRPVAVGEIAIGASSVRPIARLTCGGADSGLLTLRLQGELRSPSFTIDKKFVHLRLAGRDARVNLVIDGYTLIMNPMYGRLTINPGSDRLVWHTMPVDRWLGHRAYFELSDSTIPPHGLNPPPSSARMPANTDGYLAVSQIVFSDEADPPVEPSKISREALSIAADLSPAAVAPAIERTIANVIDRWQDSLTTCARMSEDDIACLNWLLQNGLLDATSDEAAAVSPLTTLIEDYGTLEAAIPAPQRAPALGDGTGDDEVVLIRGNYRALGESAPRGLPQVLETAGAPPAGPKSGRRELAQRLVSRQNPLLSRVIVNRLWQHHFGAGLVRTPDDFGRMGQPPTHPELLDHLASELLHGEWELKRLQRRIVTAAAYRQGSGNGNRESAGADPENRLLSHMPIRRLEAEAIRDAMLAVSGRLDHTQYGPSVLPHVTPYMEGRGKPQTGPLDGSGRRSLYINARRNFLTPLLLAFDYPVTFTPIGRRGAATIPGQALALMNDPFVVGEARQWAERTLAETSTASDQRITTLYEAAFARPPTAEELSNAIDFLQAQSLRYSTGSDDVRVWADLCHVLMNVKEFIFVE